jgi:hypothetical protein
MWVVLIAGSPALHYVLFALPTFTSRPISARSWLCRKCDGFLVAITPGHHGPRHSCDLVGERDRGDLGRPARQQCCKPRPMVSAVDLGIADDRQRARRVSNTTPPRVEKAEGVPLVGLALSLCLMAAIAALAFVACAAL